MWDTLWVLSLNCSPCNHWWKLFASIGLVKIIENFSKGCQSSGYRSRRMNHYNQLCFVFFSKPTIWCFNLLFLSQPLILSFPYFKFLKILQSAINPFSTSPLGSTTSTWLEKLAQLQVKKVKNSLKRFFGIELDLITIFGFFELLETPSFWFNHHFSIRFIRFTLLEFLLLMDNGYLAFHIRLPWAWPLALKNLSL